MTYSYHMATFGPDVLDFRVRDGNGYFHIGNVIAPDSPLKTKYYLIKSSILIHLSKSSNY